ncbi:hypothetical protein H4219_002022 [Mycoemilia scoparia]|uniref:Uncharacterized protein n=1 Tax=Mycoemilia scoparia TaxID=417184 RepID=A0A9W8DPM2_9FUNG|nr:hypothetical protein H4219_002022 [Mycoemilia scoparia]
MLGIKQTKELIAGVLRSQITHRCYSIETGKSLSSTPSSLYSGAAVVFDIDGVLIRGKNAIPQAVKALRILDGENKLNKKIPFVTLTNGGGVTEAEKAAAVSKIIDYPDGLDKDDLPVDPNDGSMSDFNKEKIHAVMVFHDPRDYGRDLQIIYDVLKSKDGVIGNGYENSGKQSVPLYFSNSDLIWSTDFVSPRFGQGAFRACLETLWDKTNGDGGNKLERILYGKPFKVQYEYTENCINSIFNDNGNGRNVYAIGDNPLSDIDGAHNYGWKSVLVRTGVYSDQTKHKYLNSNPTAIVDDVEQAVQWIVDQEVSRVD